MTYLGVIMLVVGSLGLFASLIGPASLRLDNKTVGHYAVLSLRWSFIVAVASVLLAALGLVIGGPRNISDSLGILMLAGSFVVIVVATVLLIASGMRSGASRTWAILRMTMVALVVGGFISLSFLASPGTLLAAFTDDFTSSLILIGFILPCFGRCHRAALAHGPANQKKGPRQHCDIRLVNDVSGRARGRRNDDSGCPKPNRRDRRTSVIEDHFSHSFRLVA